MWRSIQIPKIPFRKQEREAPRPWRGWTLEVVDVRPRGRTYACCFYVTWESLWFCTNGFQRVETERWYRNLSMMSAGINQKDCDCKKWSKTTDPHRIGIKSRTMIMWRRSINSEKFPRSKRKKRPRPWRGRIVPFELHRHAPQKSLHTLLFYVTWESFGFCTKWKSWDREKVIQKSVSMMSTPVLIRRLHVAKNDQTTDLIGVGIKSRNNDHVRRSI